MQHKCLLFASLALAPAFTACSGGGGGDTGSGSVNGLSGPDTVSVVTAESEPASSGLAPGANNFPPNSDFNQDRQDTHVWDPSMEPLEQVNNILCLTGMTAYPDMVNEGAYIAQIDEALCDSGGEQEVSSNAQSAGQETEFTFFTVRSARETNSSNQIVHFWVPEEDEMGNPELTIFAEMVISEAATDTDPFGEFTLNFAGVPAGSSINDALMEGTLATEAASGNNIGFTFYEELGDVTQAHSAGEFSNQTAINVSMSADQASGAAQVLNRQRFNFGFGDSGVQGDTWKVAFNETHFKRQRGSDAPVTLSRTDFITNVWRYNMYEAEGNDPGSRVELQSGFPVRTVGGEHGWAGYHGIWFPPHVDLQNGDVVTRDEFGQAGPPDEYEVVLSRTKMIRNVREVLGLSELIGIEFREWSPDGEFLVAYDGVDWVRTDEFDPTGGSWTPLSPTEVITPATGEALHLYSDQLGGPVFYIGGDLNLTYFRAEFVDGEDDIWQSANGGFLELYGFFECLDSEITSAAATAGTVFLPEASSVSTPHVYRLTQSDLTLYRDVNGDGSVLERVGLADGEEPTGGPFEWGMRSGPLVTNVGSMNSIYDIWNASEFYVCETGHNPWNWYVTLRNSLGYVEFDGPIQFSYTHSTANDRNDDASYDGQTYLLQYEGNGNLHGIPHEGVDLDGDMEPDRWYPLFSLKDGVELGPNGTEYVVKAIDMEQRLQEDPGGAPSLDLSAADALTLPTAGGYSAPSNGAMPEITDPPAVIDGVVQSSGSAE